MVRGFAGLAGLALTLGGCATTPAMPTSVQDCAVMMLAAGFIAEHQPPLRLRPDTRDLRTGLTEPERYSPDADAGTDRALASARAANRATRRLACPLTGPSPFVAWRPGRGELVLSNPAFSPAGDFAVLDARVLLPGRRADTYRFIFSGPPKGAWDIHRIEFGSAPLPIPR